MKHTPEDPGEGGRETCYEYKDYEHRKADSEIGFFVKIIIKK